MQRARRSSYAIILPVILKVNAMGFIQLRNETFRLWQIWIHPDSRIRARDAFTADKTAKLPVIYRRSIRKHSLTFPVQTTSGRVPLSLTDSSPVATRGILFLCCVYRTRRRSTGPSTGALVCTWTTRSMSRCRRRSDTRSSTTSARGTPTLSSGTGSRERSSKTWNCSTFLSTRRWSEQCRSCR